MLKTTDYKIIRTKTRKKLQEKIMEFVTEEYECQGGIVTEIENEDGKDVKYYLQAVILRREK